MKVDALSSPRPISHSVKNSREIRGSFDEISYAKGKHLNYLDQSKSNKEEGAYII